MKTNKPKPYTSKLITGLLNDINSTQYKKTEIRMQLAANIADLISEKGWSKSEFALKLNKHPSEISKWLSGTHNFTIDTLTEIASVFSLSVQQLFIKQRIVNTYISEMKTVAAPSQVYLLTPKTPNYNTANSTPGISLIVHYNQPDHGYKFSN